MFSQLYDDVLAHTSGRAWKCHLQAWLTCLYEWRVANKTHKSLINGVIIHSTHLPKESLFGVILNYLFGKENILKKKMMKVWRDHSGIKSPCCFVKEMEFGSQNLHLVTHTDLSPALETLTPSSGLRGTHMHMHICTGKHTHRYKNESLRNGKKSLCDEICIYDSNCVFIIHNLFKPILVISPLQHLRRNKWSCITEFSMVYYCNILCLLLHHTFAWLTVNPD